MLIISVIIGIITIFIVWIVFFKSKRINLSIDESVIKIATTTNECVSLINELRSYNPKVIGLDCEWSNNNKVSLLQIGHKHLTILIRIPLIQSIPSNLIDFLHDIKILKVGVGIFQDINKLKNDYNIDVFGCVDINNIFKTLSPQIINNLLSNYNNNINNNTHIINNNNTLSLKSMSSILLNKEMKYKLYAKNWRFHLNWDNKQLTKKQILYAADDALKGYQIFIKLMNVIDNKNSKSYLELCYKFIDIKKIKLATKKIKLPTKIYNNTKNIKNRKDALKYNECNVCGNKTKDLIMFSIIPQQYQLCLPKTYSYNNNKYRIPICIQNCYKKCKTNQTQFMNKIHEKHNCIMLPNKILSINAKRAAITFSNDSIKYKIPLQLKINMIKNICNYYNLCYDNIKDKKQPQDIDEKKDETIEYKWQYYDNKSNNFIDYDAGTCLLIETNYNCEKRKNKLLISNLKEYKSDNNDETEIIDGIYYIFSEHSGQVWDVIGNGKKNGVHIHQWIFHGNPNQMFRFTHCNNGNYYIECVNSGKYLTIDENGLLVQYDMDAVNIQQFKMIKLDDNGLFNIICGDINKTIQVQNASLQKSAKIIAGDLNEKCIDNEKWRLYCSESNIENNDRVEIRQINFNKMEVIKEGKYKSKIRRIYKNDIFSNNFTFNDLIDIFSNNFTCLISLTINELIEFCIEELLSDNIYENENILQEERWNMCKRKLVEIYLNNGIDFKQIWIDNFIEKMNKNYNSNI